MIIKIDIAKLTKLFFEKIVLRFDMSTDIINDRNSLFINIFWSAFWYYVKIKRRLNTVLYYRTNEQTKNKLNIKILFSKLHWHEADKINKPAAVDRICI